MVIQNLLFPREEICEEWEMYYRGEDQSAYGAQGIRLAAGQTLSLETYFNSFSMAKWMKYTHLSDLQLELQMTGEAEIRVKRSIGHAYHEPDPRDNTKDCYWADKAEHQEAAAHVAQTEDGYRVSFEELYTEGIVYVEITAKTDVCLTGGAYTTSTEPVNPVMIAVGICTFKREPFVTKNVNRIIDEILKNEQSPLYQHMEVYVSDNGQTLPADTFDSDLVHLFGNRNVGGAGGFTRDIIEAVYLRENSPFTHVILMDDDIALDCNVLERTYAFLQYLKEEYQGAMIGGELFELAKRYRQFEAGALFTHTIIQSFNQRWDMRKADNVAANEIENNVNFGGWWYNCIPVSFIKEKQLPLPVFIHRDDVEYGARNYANGTILLNGICVWHEQGPNKAPVAMNYYDVRNDLIAMCDLPTRATKWEIMNHITRGVLGNMLRYRYEVVACMFQGLTDFYKGPEFFMELDPIENHKSLARFNYDFRSPAEDGIDLSQIREEKMEDMPGHPFLRAALCQLLPTKNYTRVCSLKDIGVAFRARRIYLYDKYRDAGFMTQKNWGTMFSLLGQYLRLMNKMIFCHEKINRKWCEAKKEYTSLAFWKTYLQL